MFVLAEEVFVLAGEVFVLAGEVFVLAEEVFVLAGEVCVLFLAGEVSVLAGEVFVRFRAGEVHFLAGQVCVLANETIITSQLGSILLGKLGAREHVTFCVAGVASALTGVASALTGVASALAGVAPVLTWVAFALARMVPALTGVASVLAGVVPALTGVASVLAGMVPALTGVPFALAEVVRLMTGLFCLVSSTAICLACGRVSGKVWQDLFFPLLSWAKDFSSCNSLFTLGNIFLLMILPSSRGGRGSLILISKGYLLMASRATFQGSMFLRGMRACTYLEATLDRVSLMFCVMHALMNISFLALCITNMLGDSFQTKQCPSLFPLHTVSMGYKYLNSSHVLICWMHPKHFSSPKKRWISTSDPATWHSHTKQHASRDFS